MPKTLFKDYEQEKEKFDQLFPALDYFCTRLLCDVYSVNLEENDYEFPKWLLGQSRPGHSDVPHPYKSAEDMREKIDGAIMTLKEKEWAVIILRYGLSYEADTWDGKPKTLREIGEMFNLSGTRIRDIEEKALHKLRHPAREKYFFNTMSELQAQKEEALRQKAKAGEVAIFGSGLPVRCENCLIRAGFETIQDILRKADFSSDEPFEFLNQVPNLGRRSVQTVIDFLAPYVKGFQEKEKELDNGQEESSFDNRPSLEERISSAVAKAGHSIATRDNIEKSSRDIEF